MVEIRLAWHPAVIHRTFHPIGTQDRWVEADSANVELLQRILAEANEHYGPGTHWMESRASPNDS